ncbi:hypothetical protein [Staphylococcus phage vB_SauH_DELF3]|nr:hypothetical protein [Staphylococcus phage vB_SauH_DELF3]
MEIHLDTLDFNELTLRDNNGNILSFNIIDELKFTECKLQEETYQQSAKFACLASLYERMSINAEVEQRTLEQIGAELNLQIRARYRQSGKEPITDLAPSAVFLSDEYDQQAQVLEAWNYRKKQLPYITHTFESSIQMLVKISAELVQSNKNDGITPSFTHYKDRYGK